MDWIMLSIFAGKWSCSKVKMGCMHNLFCEYNVSYTILDLFANRKPESIKLFKNWNNINCMIDMIINFCTEVKVWCMYNVFCEYNIF